MVYIYFKFYFCFNPFVSGDACCKIKLVEGSTYTFKGEVGEEDATHYSCIDRCTYAKEGEENSMYCFAVGDMQMECQGGVVESNNEGSGKHHGSCTCTTPGNMVLDIGLLYNSNQLLWELNNLSTYNKV